MGLIYKVFTKKQFKDFLHQGTFSGNEHDLHDGFIHMVSLEDIDYVLEKFFSGQRDVVVVGFDEEGLENALKWEAASNGKLFPHLYGRDLYYADIVSERQNGP